MAGHEEKREESIRESLCKSLVLWLWLLYNPPFFFPDDPIYHELPNQSTAASTLILVSISSQVRRFLICCPLLNIYFYSKCYSESLSSSFHILPRCHRRTPDLFYKAHVRAPLWRARGTCQNISFRHSPIVPLCPTLP